MKISITEDEDLSASHPINTVNKKVAVVRCCYHGYLICAIRVYSVLGIVWALQAEQQRTSEDRQLTGICYLSSYNSVEHWIIVLTCK